MAKKHRDAAVDRRSFLAAAAGAAGAVGAAAAAPVAAAAPAAPPPATGAPALAVPAGTPARIPPSALTEIAALEVAAGEQTAQLQLRGSDDAYHVHNPGSDFMVDCLKALGYDYVAATPGSTFRGIQESVVSYPSDG